MGWGRYRRILEKPSLRTVLVLGLLVRIPTFAINLILTLHVVTKLGESYAEAGLISAAATLSLAISNPWRGRLLDRISLRRVLVPSIVIGGICGSVAPFVGYGWLAALVALSSLFTIPSFTIVRQAVIAGVDEEDRRAALSLDSVSVETAYMLGPLLGIWAASTWRTDWVLLGAQLAVACGGILLWVVNPPLRKSDAQAPPAVVASSRAALRSTPFLMLCMNAIAASAVLIATELGTVAAMHSLNARPLTGVALASWGAGSLVGGLFYGSLHRSVSPTWLLVSLSAVTLPLAAANEVWSVVALVFVAGLLCAPTIVAAIDLVSRLVPEASRGEAIGWHASSMTIGSAIGAPLAGALIDHQGWRAAFLAMALMGLAVALVTGGALRLTKR